MALRRKTATPARRPQPAETGHRIRVVGGSRAPVARAMAAPPNMFNNGSGFTTDFPQNVNIPNNDTIQYGGPEPYPAGGSDFRSAAIRAFEAQYEDSKRARLPHHAVSEESWLLYNNDWNFSDKESWQSQRRMPTVTMTVERLTAIIVRIISTSTNWFTVKSLSKKMAKKQNAVKRLVADQMRKLGFFRFFGQSIKTGLLSQHMTALILPEFKGIPNPDFSAAPEELSAEAQAAPGNPMAGETNAPTEDTGWALRLELLNPAHVYLDPTGRSRFKMIERAYTKGEFKEEAEARGWINIDAVLASTFDAPDMKTFDARKMQQPVSSFSHDMVYIRELYGDLYDNVTGMRLWKNMHFVVAQKVIPVQPPTPLPFWHKELPIIDAGLLDVPFSVYQKSLIGISLDSFKLWVEFLNLTIDYFTTLFLGQQEVDMSNLHQDEDLDSETGAPGRLWKKRHEGQLINYVQMGQTDQNIWQFISTLKENVQEGSALIDAMAGSPKSRGKQTGMEFTRRMAEAGSLLDFAFQMIEEQYILKILKQAFLVILQYMPMKDWTEWVDSQIEAFPEEEADLGEMRTWTPEERWQNLAKQFDFETRVFSAVFDRQQEIEKITFAMNVTGRIPQAAQHIKWGAMLNRLFEAFGWDPEELVSEQPIQPMSDLGAGPGQGLNPPGGQQGVGQDQPQQTPNGNETGGQAPSFLQGGGAPPPGMMQGMGARSGNPAKGGSGG